MSDGHLAVQPVILCGGAGTRLWPLSRAGFPKQFLCLTGRESLFQMTVERLALLGDAGLSVADSLICTGEDQRFLVLEQLREIDVAPAGVLLEPVARNTAPALSLAALAACGDPVLVASPADHAISDVPAFVAALRRAVEEAAEGAIVTLGVPIDRPETGYGYIQAEGAGEAKRIRRFVEKPDRETAQRYMETDGYSWNSGLFVLKASVWLAALERFRPEIASSVRTAWADRKRDGSFVRPGKKEFEVIPAGSIDYAVMEKSPAEMDVRMVPLDAGWSDLGAWDAIWQVSDKDDAGNATVGDVTISASRNTLVHASSRLVSVVGVSDLVVVETADAVLVADRRHSQDVKNLVANLAEEGREEHLLHRRVHRPWGWYDGIDDGPGFKVKRIQVKPMASLSLQRHSHRAEHWIVVKGCAEVTCGDKTILLAENQSTYIPLGEAHRLRNPGSVPLEIVEVQSGSYLGEDDIVRFEDDYGRGGES